MKTFDNTTRTRYSHEYLKEQFQDAYIKDNIVFWKSNDRSPFDDMLNDWFDLGLITVDQVNNTIMDKERQDLEAIIQYVNHRETNGYSNEEKSEIWNEIGADAVDVLTGKRIFGKW